MSPRARAARPYLLRDCVMHNYDQVINTLAAARQSQGVSLRQLAERTDCARATLAENLRGRHRMDALTLLQAAHALGYDLALVPREEA